MKLCSSCREEKEISNFGVHKTTKDRLQTACKSCMRLKSIIWKQKNAEKYKQYTSKWKQANKEAVNISNYKRAKRLRHIPWDTEFTNFVTEEAHHLRGMRDILTGFAWHVDHIVPLNGKRVSGLHVWNNLAVIPASENLQKLNKHE